MSINTILKPNFPEDKVKEKSFIIFQNFKAKNSRATNLHLKLFHNFFNLSYYFFVIPFHFKHNASLCEDSENGQTISLKVSWIRKIFGILVYLFSLTIHGHLQHSRITIVKNDFNVLLYFNIVHTILHAISFTQVCISLLFKQEVYLKMIVAVEQCRLLQHQNRLKEWYTTCFTYFISFVLLCGLPILFLLQTMESNDWDLSQSMKWQLKGDPPSSYIYTYDESYDQTNSSNELSLTDIIFRPPLASLPYRFLEGFRISAYLLHGTLLYSAATTFVTKQTSVKFNDQDYDEENLWLDQHSRKENLLKDYQDLKGLSDCINDVWGWTFFVALVDYILWFTTDLNSDLQRDAWTGRIIQVWFCSGMISLLILGAETSRKMSTFKAWVVTHGPVIFKGCPEEKSDFLAALESDGVWIGKHGLYKLNYGFLGQVAVLMITLFIITLQYELSNTQ